MNLAPLLFIVVVAAALFAVVRLMPRLIRLDAEEALLRNRASPGSEPRTVFFDRAYIIPVLDTYDRVNLSIKAIRISLKGREGVHCRDNIRADVGATFCIKIPRDAENVLTAAETIGCSDASDEKALSKLFAGRFTEAMKSALKGMDFEEAMVQKVLVRERVLEFIGPDLHGFHLEELSIEDFDQTPLELLDPDNILDAEGITKIITRTAVQFRAAVRVRES